MDRLQKTYIEILPEHSEVTLGGQKISWSSNWQEICKITQKGSVPTLVAGKDIQGICRSTSEWDWQVTHK